MTVCAVSLLPYNPPETDVSGDRGVPPPEEEPLGLSLSSCAGRPAEPSDRDDGRPLRDRPLNRAWPLVPAFDHTDCVIMVYLCTRTHERTSCILLPGMATRSRFR